MSQTVAPTIYENLAVLRNKIAEFGVNVLLNAPIVGQGECLISPAALYYSLLMLANGSSGTTFRQIMEVLGLDETIPAPEFCTAFSGFRLPRGEYKESIAMANALFVSPKCILKNAYSEDLDQSFNCPPRIIPFADPDALEAINKWCAQATKGKIASATMSTEYITTMAMFCAVGWEREWRYTWPAEDIRRREFTDANGIKCSLPTMCLSAALPYAETDHYQLARIPFRGSEFEFQVIVPKNGMTTTRLLQTENIHQALRGPIERTPVSVYLPRFELNYFLSMRGILEEMGARDAFNFNANFGRMFYAPQTPINKFNHQARFRAAQQGFVYIERDYSKKYTTVRANKPFIIAITDSYGLCLFLGIISDPKIAL